MLYIFTCPVVRTWRDAARPCLCMIQNFTPFPHRRVQEKARHGDGLYVQTKAHRNDGLHSQHPIIQALAP